MAATQVSCSLLKRLVRCGLRALQLTERSIALVALFRTLGWVVFKIGHWKGVEVPTGDEPYTKFCAFIYSLETFVPLVKLEMAEYWIPDPNRRAGSIFRVYLWIQILLGWVLTTLLVAAFTGIIKN
jgi:hypothetical protein